MRCLFLLLLLTCSAHAFAQSGAKRPITHGDYDTWKSIQGAELSADGKYLAYALVPEEGDGEIVVRHLATGKEWRHPRGSQPAPPPTPAAAAIRRAEAMDPTRPTDHHFTADGRFFVFRLFAAKAEVDKARKAKKKPEEMPKNSLAIMDLASGAADRIERVKSFQIPEKGSGFIAYLREPPLDEKKSEKQDEKTSAAGKAALAEGQKKKEYGTDLVLRNLPDKSERVFADVLEYSLSKDAKLLLYAVASKQQEKNGLFAVTAGVSSAPVTLLSGKGQYKKLTWDEKQTQLAFLSDRDDAAAKQPKFKLYHWLRKGSAPALIGMRPQPYQSGASARAANKGTRTRAEAATMAASTVAMQKGQPALATELTSANTPGLHTGWLLSDKGSLAFSQDGARLFLGTVPPPPPEKDQSKSPAAEDKVSLDLWHWKDDYIQPMQKVRAEQVKNHTYRAVFHLKEKKLVQLADESMPEATPSSDGRWALGVNDRPYRRMLEYDTNYSDYYLVNTLTGNRKPFLHKQAAGVTWSPKGTYGLFYHGKHWFSVSSADGKITNLTAKLGVNVWNEQHDMPGPPAPYGLAGWTTNDKFVLLYDRYDVWQIAPDGSSARNVTAGLGRKEKLLLRYAKLDSQEKGINAKRPLLLHAENEDTRATGFVRVRLDGSAPEVLLMAEKNLGFPIKAKSADVVVLTQQTFNEFPDLHFTDLSFKKLTKVTNANPQKAKLLWGGAELVHFKNADGVPLTGMLVKPENFDPHKKYPMLVYIYERLSQNLHHFVSPSPGTSINVAYYASNGYLVLMPDIVYTTGYPGQSALKCVLPAVQAVVDRGYVDENAIGIQGHSWGGYQIAYMITQTNRFKAVEAGAPVANMTSAYDGIRWGPGLPRQFQYEQSQSRIGGSLWQFPMRFVENSPIFMADRVHTPIMILHNDQDDAVPWYQGIEYFLALRRLGKEAYLFNYNGELHGLRKRVNQKDYTVRMQEFFDHYLKGAPKPEWMVKGIPYVEKDKADTPAAEPQAPRSRRAGR
jgi:dipeptidyl aminopeptidase/acylaminoacyl peptidase